MAPVTFLVTIPPGRLSPWATPDSPLGSAVWKAPPTPERPIVGSFALWMLLCALRGPPSWKPRGIDFWFREREILFETLVRVASQMGEEGELMRLQSLVSTRSLQMYRLTVGCSHSFPYLQFFLWDHPLENFFNSADLSVCQVAITSMKPTQHGWKVSFVLSHGDVLVDVLLGNARYRLAWPKDNGPPRMRRYLERGFMVEQQDSVGTHSTLSFPTSFADACD